MSQECDRLNLFIASPLEEEHVARIRTVAPGKVDVAYLPDLLPPTRYIADHIGSAGFTLSSEQEARWRHHLSKADILWDFPPDSVDGSSGLSLAPRVKWIQATSSGIGSRVERLGLQHSNIILTTARGVHASPLAEFVFHALIGHWKRHLRIQAAQKRRHWERYCGEELAGKTLAIIGVGEVGRRIIQIGQAFGMRVVATRIGSHCRRPEGRYFVPQRRSTQNAEPCRRAGPYHSAYGRNGRHDRSRRNRGTQARGRSGKHRARSGDRRAGDDRCVAHGPYRLCCPRCLFCRTFANIEPAVGFSKRPSQPVFSQHRNDRERQNHGHFLSQSEMLPRRAHIRDDEHV
jgi:hypothetical protein